MSFVILVDETIEPKLDLLTLFKRLPCKNAMLIEQILYFTVYR